MPDKPHSDYKPPGDLLNPIRPSRRIRSMSFAYSRCWNPRRLESTFYGVWDDQLRSIIDDTDFLEVIPQLLLYRRRGVPPVLEADTSTATQAEPKADEIIPDFAIAATALTPRTKSPPSSEGWNHMTVVLAIILALIELKRPVSRSIKDPALFIPELSTGMAFAIDAVEGQAALLFASNLYTKHDEVLLIAVCGEWFTWKVARRSHYILPKVFPRGWAKDYHQNKLAEDRRKAEEAQRQAVIGNEEGETDDEDSEEDQNEDGQEMSDGGFEEEDKDHDIEANPVHGDPEFTLDSVDSDDDSEFSGEGDDGTSDIDELEDAPPINRFEGITGEEFEQEVDNIEDAWPGDDDWSRFLRLGTPAANQRLYLIDRFLRNLKPCDVLEET